MATLREIQLEELKMLKLLDKYCQEYNLKYFMVGGTMLGAIRHNGFIPWDDDIDVCMPYKDFKILQRNFQSSEYFLQSPESDIQTPFIVYKIRKNNSYMHEPGTEGLNIHQGIWLDIFVYFDAAKTNYGRKSQIILSQILQTYRCRYRYVKKQNRRLIHYLLTKLPNIVQLYIDKLILFLISLLGNQKSLDNFALPVEAKYYFLEKKYSDELTQYNFESCNIVGIKNYDSYLKRNYGNDYMIPKQWNHLGNYESVIINIKN